ncbi:MAG: ParB/RepB/Spo0J family partition protein, partial [Oscillospiraceae bacterium]|nr:ParB/RepB/Spo0J family partition protein [Oscillospiraceae bacterium]
MKILNREKEIQNDEKITIPIDELQPFEEHPYKVLDNEEMEQLVESIRENGVLTPILVTHLDLRADKYDIVSGHRRYAACKKLGVTEIPAVYKEMTYDEAVITMVDANLQREHILPSEKAKAFQMKLEAIKHQGRTSAQFGQKWSVEQVAADSKESRSQVQRYIRLNNLIPELLQMVDEGRIAL